MDDFITAKQVIELLKIDRTTLYRMLREERIKGVKVGSQWRFPKAEIEILLQPLIGPDHQQPSRDILPMHCVQPIQEVFSDIIQTAAITTDVDGVPLSNLSNTCKFCEQILSSQKGRAACYKSWKELEFSNDDETTFSVCHAGLNYAGANIILDGKKIAKLITGQFYSERPDAQQEEKRIKKLANDYGLNEKKLLKAALEIVLIDQRITQFLGKWMQKVARSFATLGYERRELLNKLKNISEMSKF